MKYLFIESNDLYIEINCLYVDINYLYIEMKNIYLEPPKWCWGLLSWIGHVWIPLFLRDQPKSA